MSDGWALHYDRRVSAEFLAQFKPGMPAHLLAEIATLAPYPLDLQFRKNPKTNAKHASLYVGLTDVLKVRPTKSGGLRLSAHPTWSESVGKPKDRDFGFDPAWSSEVKQQEWSLVEDYLERVLPAATMSHGSQEGAVQTAVSKNSAWTALDREAVLHFWDQQTKAQIMAETVGPVLAALSGLAVKGAPKTTFGGECDLLALDSSGRLLAVEIKPRNVGTIRWAAAQATVYSALFRRWLEHEALPCSPIDVLNGEWQQREAVGLARPPAEALTAIPEVTPVVVIQRGTRPDLIDDFRKVHDRLVEYGAGAADLHLYRTGMTGHLTPLESAVAALGTEFSLGSTHRSSCGASAD